MSVRIVVNTDSLDQISSAMDKALSDLHANSKVLEKAYTDLHTQSEGQYFMKVDSYFAAVNGTGNQLVDQLYHSSEFVKKASSIFTAVDAATDKKLEENFPNNEKIGIWVHSQFGYSADESIPRMSFWKKIFYYPKPNLPWIQTIVNKGSVENASLDMQMDEAARLIKETYDEYGKRWGKMSANDRLSVLQKIEDQMAVLQGREALSIHPEDGMSENGNFDPGNPDIISINANYLTAKPPFASIKSALKTLLHEGRHATQFAAFSDEYNRDDYTNSTEWENNMNNYIPGIVYGPYKNQPVEYDANGYADEIMRRMQL